MFLLRKDFDISWRNKIEYNAIALYSSKNFRLNAKYFFESKADKDELIIYLKNVN